MDQQQEEILNTEEVLGDWLLEFNPDCKISQRCIDWSRFAFNVANHIEEYTVPQYGDKPNDNVESWTADDCVKQVLKYINRRGKSRRPGEEKLDLIKCAHYIQLAYDKAINEPS